MIYLRHTWRLFRANSDYIFSFVFHVDILDVRKCLSVVFTGITHLSVFKEVKGLVENGLSPILKLRTSNCIQYKVHKRYNWIEIYLLIVISFTRISMLEIVLDVLASASLGHTIVINICPSDFIHPKHIFSSWLCLAHITPLGKWCSVTLKQGCKLKS